MSAQENTNIVKQAYDAFMRGDIEGLLNLYADDVQWEVYGPSSIPTAGTWPGKEGIGRFFATVNDALEVHSFEPQEFIAQDDQVAVLGHYDWTARATGRPFSANWVHVMTVRDGKITRFREYTDTAAAVAALAG